MPMLWQGKDNDDDNGLSMARGFINALILSIIFWGIIGLLAWLILSI